MITDSEILDLLNLECASQGITAFSTQSAAELEAKGWRVWYAEMFGQSFVDVLAVHHVEAIEWHWNARMAQRRGEKPDYLAYFSIWSRGHMKSTLAKRIAIADACLSINSPEKGGYCLYVSGTADKVKGHAKSIESLLNSDKIGQYYPALQMVRKSASGSSKGWTADFIYTDAGYVFHFIGLDKGVAGANVDDVRPTFIVPDDIDDREDSPTISESRFQTFTRAVIPTRQSNTLIFFAQNLISRYSVMYRIYKGQARVLTNRFVTHPIPACYNLETEVRTVNGILKDIVLDCEPTWEFYGKERIQEEIDSMGLDAFMLECLHLVDQSKAGLILHNFNDDVHVITESEFIKVYGSLDAWRTWNKWTLNDWARTKTARHANVAAFITVSNQNSKLPGMTFLFHPMSFPANSEPEDVGEKFLTKLSPFAYQNITWATLRRDCLLRENAQIHTNTLTERLEYERAALSRVIPNYARPLLQKYNVRGGVMGHSDLTVQAIYNNVFALNMQGVNPGKLGGVETINQAMKIDFTVAHPFRPEQMGYTRWFIVVPDNKIKYEDALQPDDLHDHDLIRYQFKNWRLQPPKLSSTGETIDEPLKLNDDFGQALQMFYFANLMSNTELTTQEIMQEQMRLITPFAGELKDEMSVEADISRQMAGQFAVQAMKKEGYEVDRWGVEIERDELSDISGGW